jgi:hypothetical protein
MSFEFAIVFFILFVGVGKLCSLLFTTDTGKSVLAKAIKKGLS